LLFSPLSTSHLSFFATSLIAFPSFLGSSLSSFSRTTLSSETLSLILSQFCVAQEEKLSLVLTQENVEGKLERVDLHRKGKGHAKGTTNFYERI